MIFTTTKLVKIPELFIIQPAENERQIKIFWFVQTCLKEKIDMLPWKGKNNSKHFCKYILPQTLQTIPKIRYYIDYQ